MPSLRSIALLLAAVSASCGDDRPAGPERPVDTSAVVIGIDGADWKVIDQLIAQGDLPHLRGLVERGVRADLATVRDIPLSPVIWTTAATGKNAAEHGITWFLVDQPDGTRTPVRSTNRKTEALWTIADRAGLGVASVGWWATYPAERLRNGLMVSDALGFHGFGSTARAGQRDGKVHPAAWFERIDALMPVEQQIGATFARRFLDLEVDEYEAERYDPGRGGPRHPFNPIHLFQQYAVTAQGYTAIAEEVLDQDAFELCLFYFEQVDSFSHLFMKYDPPRLEWIDERGYGRYSRVVREWYRYQDEILGRLLAKIDLDRTAVILLSDHGFKSGDRRIRSERVVDVKKAHLDHETHGVFVAAGPHFRRGAEIRGAAVIDLTPTVLHYLGLPVGKDMAGKVLTDALEPSFVEEHPIRYVTTHEIGREPDDGLVPSDGADAGDAMAGLRALGYAGEEAGGEPMDDDAANPAAVKSSPEMHNNLARVHLGSGDLDAALAEFGKALELDERNADALLGVGRVHLAAGRTELATRAAQRALQMDPDSVAALGQLAEARQDEGRIDDAIRLYREAIALDDSRPGLYLGLGDALQRAGRLEEAERAFRGTLELDPDSFRAHYNLGVTYAALGRIDDAIASYEASIEKAKGHPESAYAWNNLGTIHSDAGRVDEALDAYGRAAELASGHLESRFNAAMIHLGRGELDEASALLEAASAIAPDHELVHVQLGFVQLEQGRVEEARRSLLLVRRLDPNNVSAAVGLASILAAQGRDAEARSLFDEALGVDVQATRALAERLPPLAGY